MHALPTAIPIAKTTTKKLYFIFFITIILTNYNKAIYGKAEQQNFRAAEACTRPPLDEVPLRSCSRPTLDEAPLHSCSMPRSDEAPLHSCSMPPTDEALLHSCSMPSTRPGPSARTLLLQTKPSAEPTTLQLKRHCKQTIIIYQHMKLSCNIQLEL